MPSVSPLPQPHAPHSTPERRLQSPPALSVTVPPPAFPPPDPECSSGSIGRPDPRPPSDGRDWGEAHRSEAFLRHSLLPPFSDPAFLQLSYQFRQYFFRIPLRRAPRLRRL